MDYRAYEIKSPLRAFFVGVNYMARVFKRKIIADLLNLSEKRVKQLTDEGILTEIKKDHYGLKDSVQCYVKYLQNMISDRDYSSDYNVEKTRLTKAKREKEEMELALKSGALHKAEDITFTVSNMLIAFKSKMLSIPSKLAPKVAKEKDINTINALLTDEINEALNELSEYKG